MSLAIVRAEPVLPEAFAGLRVASVAEGYAFLRRLEERWRDGAYDDDRLCTVRLAYDGGNLIGIGAQTYDEYDPGPDQRRMRHFYVLPSARRNGAGRALASVLIEDAFALAPKLRLRATHAVSRAFWEAMGFVYVGLPSRSHEKLRPA